VPRAVQTKFAPVYSPSISYFQSMSSFWQFCFEWVVILQVVAIGVVGSGLNVRVHV